MKKPALLAVILAAVTLFSACSSQATPAEYSERFSYDVSNPTPTAAASGMSTMYDSSHMYESDQIGATEWNTEEYNVITERGFVTPQLEPLSTFSASVDTASYSIVRSRILSGASISPDMVRIEEFINYFSYDYAAPEDGTPLALHTELSDCPWSEGHLLLLVALQGEKVDLESAPPFNLVFLIDTSGSMSSADKLPLVKEAMTLLAQNMRDGDRISVVTYAGSSAVLLDGATGEDSVRITDTIDSLTSGGSTNGAGGITEAYACAARNFIAGGINRVILATDGDFNVGVTSDGELKTLIEGKRDTGVYLSLLGFGRGNYKDSKMETLSKYGNGNAYYIDSALEARKVLVEQMGGTLVTIAKDVKLQLEFNPSAVKAYRLIGYDNHNLNAEDFADDAVDAGEIGSGHSVTALYEIIPAGSDEEVPGIELKYQQTVAVPSDELLTVSLRFKRPDAAESELVSAAVAGADRPSSPSDNMKWAQAVAQFALVLRQSDYLGGSSARDARDIAVSVAGYGDDPYKAEFVELVDTYLK